MSRKPTRARIVGILLLLGVCFAATPAVAQIEAFAGQPFGVGKIVLRIPKSELPQPLGAEGIMLTEARGRVFYPVIETPPDRTIVRQLLVESPLLKGGPVRQEVGGIIQGFLDQTPPTTIYFLFKGTEPLDLRIGTRTPMRRIVHPLRSQEGLNRVARDWWKQYTARPKSFLGLKTSDYPPVVRGYLESMLSARLNFPLPPLGKKDPTQAMLEEQLGLMLGTELIQTAMIRDRMLGDASLSEKLTLPLPIAKKWPPLTELQVAKDVKIEPIAMRVPEECFYIRFGNYANFLWLQDTLKRIGGDAGNLISLRGLDYESSKRMEEHLLVKQTVLGRVLGGTLISDVAMIGTDMFMREGASMGLLFEARNTFMLDREFTSQRAARVKQGGVTEETLTIDGRKVSFIHSEDDTVRSFYLADNGYILVTSSEEVMRRFIATGKKEPTGALGATDEFRHARTVMPITRNDTVFVYFSDAFFRNMAGPHYWIEMRRRLQAAADIEILTMARLAATGEEGVELKKNVAQTIPPLQDMKLLPSNFGPRPDGSQPVFDSRGQLIDSLRGRRGFFVPIPDIPVKKITPAEAAAYRRFLEFYHENWGRLDPMIIGVRRDDLGKGLDRITVDAQANPFAKKHYDTLLRRTGPAEARKIAPVQGNIIDLQVVLPDQYLFAGLQDVQLPTLAVPQNPNPQNVPHIPGVQPAPNPATPLRVTPIIRRSNNDPGPVPGRRLRRLRDAFLAPPPPQPGVVVAPPQPIAVAPQQPRVGLLDIFVGYIGTTGELGFLSIFQALVSPVERIPGQDATGGLRLHDFRNDQFHVFSFQQWLLQQVCPQLHFVKAEPAQLRLDVGDVARAKITPTLNRLSYVRTRTTSLGNLRLLHSLHQQLRVPEGSCLTTAENLLDAKLVCPLGGKYELRRDPSGRTHWTSTSLTPVADTSPLKIPVPSDYVGPPLSWFRGLKMDAAMTPKVLSAHAELMMKLPKMKKEN